MKDEWDNPEFAREWDQTALQINPTRAEELELLVQLLEEEYQEGATILDLGIGSGLVEALLFAHLPHASVVGVDSSSVMLGLAAQRLTAFERQCTLIAHDYTDLEHLVVPPRKYQVVISVQALHHVPHDKKQALFQFVADLLEPGGLFLLIDRIALDTPHFADLYRAMWKHVEDGRATKGGLSPDDFLERLQGKEDHPASLEEHLSWLRRAGLSATCLHLHLHRALIAGKKSEETEGGGEKDENRV
jgi:cyclopropane fatty-acyl-phospholipid synthase-like methyltransferase